MTYWRMQLHPDDRTKALKHSVQSLEAGYIGLDFRDDVGDLARMGEADRQRLSPAEKRYLAFVDEMGEGDKVLISVHNFPFALATVDGGYNYIRRPAPEIGVWFRHFRKVKDVMYYGDYDKNAAGWESTPMAETITPLRDSNKPTYQLIERWVQSVLTAAA